MGYSSNMPFSLAAVSYTAMLQRWTLAATAGTHSDLGIGVVLVGPVTWALEGIGDLSRQGNTLHRTSGRNV
jgi:hypothetical protein